MKGAFLGRPVEGAPDGINITLWRYSTSIEDCMNHEGRLVVVEQEDEDVVDADARRNPHSYYRSHSVNEARSRWLAERLGESVTASAPRHTGYGQEGLISSADCTFGFSEADISLPALILDNIEPYYHYYVDDTGKGIVAKPALPKRPYLFEYSGQFTVAGYTRNYYLAVRDEARWDALLTPSIERIRKRRAADARRAKKKKKATVKQKYPRLDRENLKELVRSLRLAAGVDDYDVVRPMHIWAAIAYCTAIKGPGRTNEVLRPIARRWVEHREKHKGMLRTELGRAKVIDSVRDNLVAFVDERITKALR